MKAKKTQSPKGFTDAEKAAMSERAKELRAEGSADGESEVIAKIAAMPEPDRAMAKKIHGIIKANAPTLAPRTWYGMPAYANADGTAVVFFQPASKFKARYSTLGFNGPARLDEGVMWPVAYALTKLTASEEAKIAALVKKAVS